MDDRTRNEAEEMNDEPISDESELPPEISDLPTEVTESYGTGVHQQPGLNIGGRTMHEEMDEYNEVGSELTGGDIDAAWSEAEVTGDEAMGGTAPTPDQDIVDDLGKAVGLEMDDKSFLWTTEALENRDSRRWELEPKSSEDYEERRQEE
jgi:hypothetical protein